jgi:hypothetical protein
MFTAFALILSGILIGLGISLIVRDVKKKSLSGAFVWLPYGQQAASTKAPVEVTISHRAEPAAEPPGAAEVKAAPQSVGEGRPQAAVERQWAALAPSIAGGVAEVNRVLDPAGIVLRPAGEPAWSYKNRGFGTYHRVLVGDVSLAWLRLELSADGELHATVRAHKEEHRQLNAAAHVPTARLTPAHVSDLLSQCLASTVKYAVDAAPGPRSANSEYAVAGGAWQASEPIVEAALRATNGALAQAGARLSVIAPAAWQPGLGRHRLVLSVQVNGRDVARMHIDRQSQHIEVAVGLPDARLIALGRCERVRVDGLTPHALAEVIAGCAWPTIAHYRDDRRQA